MAVPAETGVPRGAGRRGATAPVGDPILAESGQLPTLTDAVFDRILAILIAFHGIVMHIAGIDALRLGLAAGFDAGIAISSLCPGHRARHDHQVQHRNSQHRI